MPSNQCERCHEPVENTNARLCDACAIIHYRLERYPDGKFRGMGWYHKGETYTHIEAFGHSNATRTPATGWDDLDQHVPRIYEFMPQKLRQFVTNVAKVPNYRDVRDDLTAEQREVAAMYWHQGLGLDQIGVILSISHQAVSGRLSRAAKVFGIRPPSRGLGRAINRAESLTTEQLDSLSPDQIKARL